ncbi:LIM and calponin homology domains-containing protein 1-like [Sardina pilchardus]|uniref:LIM and calponin homology domains-containing protein 1-like n=1 Tax=Sardina pilchardus TaxID=27697 RepID=UPI002E0E9882
MASPGADHGPKNQDHNEHHESTPEPAFQEAQKWIEAVTGRSFGDKDFRGGLENGILLCELLSSIKPGLVKKINRLPTPIAGLDNLTLFLRGCEELGLKGSQLFDPGDLQDTSIRANLTGSDCSRKLKNVLITIYWLGKAANGCTTYSGPTLDLKEFEGLLSHLRKECEDTESPKRSIRDSGYIDCWDSERSESLSPPRHCRDDSFDSLDSYGSRSQQTPSPDVVLRGNSDGRGSDSEGDSRKLPDVRKDDMLARRTSYNEPRAAVPFNQYLPNKSNQGAYVPTPLRRKRPECEEGRKSWSSATSPVGAERTHSHPEPIQEESLAPEGELDEGQVGGKCPVGSLREVRVRAVPRGMGLPKTVTWAQDGGAEEEQENRPEMQEEEEEEMEERMRKMKRLEKAGIKVLPASVRYGSPRDAAAESDGVKPASPDIILRCENDFLRNQQAHAWDSDEEEEEEDAAGGERKVPDVRRDDLASRRARMNRGPARGAHHFLPGSCSRRDQERWEALRRKSQQAKDDLARRRAKSRPQRHRDPLQPLLQTSMSQRDMERWQRLKLNTEASENEPQSPQSPEVAIITRKENPFLSPQRRREGEEEEEERKKGQGAEEEEEGRSEAVPNVQKDDLAKRRAQRGPRPHREPVNPLVQASITQADMEKWQRLKMTTEDSSDSPPICQACIEKISQPPAISTTTAAQDDLASRRARGPRRSPGSRQQRFVTFGPVTEMDQRCWERLSIARPGQGGDEDEEEEEEEEEGGKGERDESQTLRRLLSAAPVAMPTIGASSPLQKRLGSPDTASDPTAASSAHTSVRDIGRPLTSAEHEQLDDLLAQYGRRVPDEREEEGREEEEEEERQPDVRKDDMLARRTAAQQKSGGVQAHNRFLPMPGGAKAQPPRDAAQNGHAQRRMVTIVGNRPKPEAATEYSEWNIKTTRNWIGQRTESQKQEPKVSTPPVATEMQKDLYVASSVGAAGHRQGSVDRACGDDWDEEYDDDGPLPDPEKDDMLARRTGAHQKAVGGTGQRFLPVPGTARYKSTPAASVGQSQQKPKDRFSHRAASAADEPESMSMFDMRCEEEAILPPHSQSRHEDLGDNKEDEWQDDLARWKNRRRSASQDLIKKENERKMMEKMMKEEHASALRRKSIKTYKEIVEEKERREQELHEAYDRACTPEEKAAVLQRYALRFTISDAILERLQIPQPPEKGAPQLPSAATTATATTTAPASDTATTPTDTDTARAPAPVAPPQPRSPPVASQPKQPQRPPSPAKFTPGGAKAAVEDAPKPKVPSQQQTRTMSPPFQPQGRTLTPEQSPTRAPPAPSKPVPLFTPKPYSQPRPNQTGHKPVKSLQTDGLVRINGEMNAEDKKEITRLSSPPPPLPPTAPAANQSTAGTTQGGATVAPPTSPLTSAKPPQEERQPSSPQRDTTKAGEEREEEQRATPTSPSPLERSQGGEQASADVTQSPLRVSEQKDLAAGGKRNCVIKTTIVTELTHTQVIDESDATTRTWMNSSASSAQSPEDQSVSYSEYSRTDSAQSSTLTSSSTTVPDSSHSSGSSRLRWEFFATPEGLENPMECIETPILNLAKRVDHWTWDPNEERKRQERWQQEQERLLKEKYQREQEKLKQEWERAQREVEEEEKRHHEEERRILEETMTPLTSRSGSGGLTSPVSSPQRTQDSIVLSLSELDRKLTQDKQTESGGHTSTHNGVAHTQSPTLHSPAQTGPPTPVQQNGKVPSPLDNSESATPQLQFIQDGSWRSSPADRKPQSDEWKKTSSLDRNFSSPQNYPASMRRSGSYENVLGSSTPSPTSPDTLPPSPSRSVSGKKLCSSCAQPLGKGAAMIIETLGLYFHIQCFKCGMCKGLLGDTSTGTDVRIRNGLLNCQECYIKSRAAGQPTTL